MDPPPATADPENSSETIELVSTDHRKPLPPQSKPPVAPFSIKADSQADPFTREAAKQYAAGNIDPALWDRAFTKADGDREKAAEIYMAARATSLRLLDRERRQKSRAAATAKNAPPPLPDFLATPPGAREFMRQREPSPMAKYGMLGGIAAAVLLLGGGAFWYFTNGDSSEASLAATAVHKPAKKAEPVAPVVEEAAKGPSIDLLKKIEDLRLAGNWNLAVIYTAELTRKDPLNPAVWDQLRDGYMHLHQYDDARDAAVKAADRAPGVAQMWRNLGEIYVNLNDNNDAVAAFNHAVSIEPNDLTSLKQIALLNARMRNLAESRAAIDQVLSLDPNDALARCYKLALTQILADAKDTRTTAMAVDAMDAKCRGTGMSEAAPAAVAAPAATSGQLVPRKK